MTPVQYQSISDLYALLSRLWLREVDQPLLNRMLDSQIAETLSVTQSSCDDDSIEALAVEYCRLFIGPKNHLPPFQSVWQTGQLQSEVTDSVRSFAEAVGIAETPNQEMPDHLGRQLEVMSQITKQLGNFESDEMKELATEYFRRHLTWPKKLLAAAERQSKSDFYRAMIGLTSEVLSSETEYWL